MAEPPAFDRTIAVCSYAAPLDQLVLSLKFGQRLAVAPALADLLANKIKRDGASGVLIADLLLPVPLSAARLAERGFNQSLEIARPLARSLLRPLYPRLLQRCRDTIAQSLLPPTQRRSNLRHAFNLNPVDADKIRGKHVGVVDDVMTTGATLQEIAGCLIKNGARTVTNYVFARTPQR
jgi:ComF family protein